MNKINGQQWKEALISGSYQMVNDSARIDALNVFPVPDGDTGSNMGATAEYAAKEIASLDSNDIHLIASKFSRGMLMGARGNSGVITSQIFKGLSVGFEGKTEATAFDVVKAFVQAKEYAYKSVMKPIEGTILTVIRMVSENLSKNVTASDTIINVFEKAVKFAREACDATPDMLPVLKEVGVTDSGGEGLYLLIEGMKLSFEGKPVAKSNETQEAQGSFFDGPEDFDGEFGYCTEFIVDLKAPKAFNKDKFAKALEKFGSSIGVVHDDDILKVHIHVLKPGGVLNFAQKFGEFIKIKSENMTLQANESQALKKDKNPSKEKLNIGIIACNVGNGIIKDMKELGADFIIEGGQTNNPSAADFIQAINQLNTERIIILPNNSNIILVAQQVAQTVQDKEILIVTSKTQMQGLSALMNFDRDASLEDNQNEMMAALGEVATGQITLASRTTKIEGVSVNEGEYLSIADRKIIGSEKSKVTAAEKVIKKLVTDDTEMVTIYYGDDSTLTDANELSSFVETHYDVEVEVKNGGQPVYNFLIAIE